MPRRQAPAAAAPLAFNPFDPSTNRPGAENHPLDPTGLDTLFVSGAPDDLAPWCAQRTVVRTTRSGSRRAAPSPTPPRPLMHPVAPPSNFPRLLPG